MITREQLELAALAAGHTIVYWTDAGKPVVNEHHNGSKGRFLWCPHLDDGDAARLAVRLSMTVAVWEGSSDRGGYVEAETDEWTALCLHDGTEPDKMRAWREAVTLCAAAVGERMQKGGA